MSGKFWARNVYLNPMERANPSAPLDCKDSVPMHHRVHEIKLGRQEESD
jgi:hypothetical protein